MDDAVRSAREALRAAIGARRQSIHARQRTPLMTNPDGEIEEMGSASSERALALEDSEQERSAKLEGWRPIESAPKDGTQVLLASASCGYMVGRWLSGGWDDGDFHSFVKWPTHWMPLPEPPLSSEEQPTGSPGSKANSRSE